MWACGPGGPATYAYWSRQLIHTCICAQVLGGLPAGARHRIHLRLARVYGPKGGELLVQEQL
jgi:hypothetical protein